MKRLIVALVAPLMLVVGCNTIESGQVVSKEYDDPDNWSSIEPVYIQQCQTEMRSQSTYVNGKYETRYVPETVCHQQVAYYHPVQHYDGPHWRFRLRSTNGEGWHTVTEGEYGSYAIGEHYPRTKVGHG